MVSAAQRTRFIQNAVADKDNTRRRHKETLVAMNVSSFVWSVGGDMPMELVGIALAKKWKVPWFASESMGSRSSGLLLQGGGAELPGSLAPIDPVKGYTGKAKILHAEVELPVYF